MRIIGPLVVAFAVGLVLPALTAAQSAASPAGTLKTYVNTLYGFSLDYPADLAVEEPYDGSWSEGAAQGYGSDDGIPVVSFTIFHVEHSGDATGQPYPLFFSAWARVGVSNNTAACFPSDVPVSPAQPAPSDVSINGITFVHFTFEDAAMSKYESAESYRTIHDGRCYAVEQVRIGSSYRDSSMTPGISREQLKAYYNAAGDIVRTFRFTDTPPG